MSQKIIQKDNLKIIIEYTGKEFIYGDDEETEKELWGPEIEKMLVEFPNGETVDISEMLPEYTILIGPVTKAFGYDNYERYITFENPDKNGSLLEILHEIGHARINKRYEHEEQLIKSEKDIDNRIDIESKRERHAWGWALGVFRELRRKELDLEPTMQEENEIKDFIKDSLLSHEVMNRTLYFLHDEEFQKEKPLKFWQSAKTEELDEYINEIYDSEKFDLTDDYLLREKMKKTFGIENKIK